MFRRFASTAPHSATARRSIQDGGGLSLSAILSGPSQKHSAALPCASRFSGTACLQLSLPPLWTWTAQEDASQLSTNLSCYVELLLQEKLMPSVLFLRLFPDSSVAQLTHPVPGHARSKQNGKREPTMRGLPAHRLPLDAFIEAEHPWGSSAGGSAHAILRKALANLDEVLLRRVSGLPVVLVLPTRMAVTQTFCAQLMDVVSRRTNSGENPVVGIALELPPNHVLYEPEVLKGSPFSWARLSLLTTPWDSLLRCDRFAEELAMPLRHRLRQETLLPLHVLVPWMLSEGMFSSVDVALAADTVLPPPGVPLQRAILEGPDCFTTGIPSESPQLQFTDSQRGGDDGSFTTYMSAATNERSCCGEEAKSRAVYTAAAEALRTDKQSRQRASEEAQANMDAVSSAFREQSRQQPRRAAPAASLKQLFTTPPSEPADGLLTLDAPPESLRRLILESVTPGQEAGQGQQQQQHRKLLYEQFGKLVAKTFKPEGNEAKDDGAVEQGDSDSHNDKEDVEREMQKLEDLLSAAEKEANPVKSFADMQSAMERELAAFQRMTSTHSLDANPDKAESTVQSWVKNGGHRDINVAAAAAARTPTWRSVEGYWCCLKVLHEKISAGRGSGPAVAVTMPTCHAAQVANWANSFRERVGRALTDSPVSGAPLVVPVCIPELSPPDLDIQRAMRERRQLRKEEAVSDLHQWLPRDTANKLAETLSQLPTQLSQSERLLAVRESKLARGSTDDDIDARGSFFAASSITFSQEETGHGEVVIRRRPVPRRPYWYSTPQRVETEKTERFRQIAKAEAQKNGDGALSATEMRKVCDEFKQTTMRQALTDFSHTCATDSDAAGVIALALPSPGFAVDDVYNSWRSLTD